MQVIYNINSGFYMPYVSYVDVICFKYPRLF